MSETSCPKGGHQPDFRPTDCPKLSVGQWANDIGTSRALPVIEVIFLHKKLKVYDVQKFTSVSFIAGSDIGFYSGVFNHVQFGESVLCFTDWQRGEFRHHQQSLGPADRLESSGGGQTG